MAYRTRQEALAARDMLSGRKIDLEKGCILKAEMAKKNLHVRRENACGSTQMINAAYNEYIRQSSMQTDYSVQQNQQNQQRRWSSGMQQQSVFDQTLGRLFAIDLENPFGFNSAQRNLQTLQRCDNNIRNNHSNLDDYGRQPTNQVPTHDSYLSANDHFYSTGSVSMDQYHQLNDGLNSNGQSLYSSSRENSPTDFIHTIDEETYKDEYNMLRGFDELASSKAPTQGTMEILL